MPVSIKISVSYNRRENSEFASCSINDVELEASVLDRPDVFAAAVKTAYARCVEAVDRQLIGHAAQPPAPPAAVNPAVARASQPPPPPATLPLDPRHATAPAPPPPAPLPPAVAPPLPGSSTYYGNNGIPKNGKQLGGWAKTNGCLPWFEAFGAAQKPSPLPKLCSQWNDQWAVYAYGQYMAAQPAPATNGAPY
jgi:hypothetical protein